MRRWSVLVPLVLAAAAAVPEGIASASDGCDSFNAGSADGVGPELGGNQFDQGEVVRVDVPGAASISIEVWLTGAPFDAATGPPVLAYEIPVSGAYQFFGTEPDLGPFELTCTPVPQVTIADTGATAATATTTVAAALALAAGALMLLIVRRSAPR